MKRLIIVLFLIALNLSSGAQGKDEVKLTAAVEQLRQALLSGNRAELEKLTWPALKYWHSKGRLENREQFIDALASKRSDFKTIELSGQTITISENTALVHHNLSAEINDGGVPGTVKLGVLLVWQRTGKEWKLLARHAYPEVLSPKS